MASENIKLTSKNNLLIGVVMLINTLEKKKELPVFTMELAEMYLKHHAVQLPEVQKTPYKRRFRKAIRRIEVFGLRTSSIRTEKFNSYEKRIDGF